MKTSSLFRTLLVLCPVVIAVACTPKFDDTELWNAVNAHSERIATLEAWQQQINADIYSLQAFVAASRNNHYIVSIEPFTTGNGGYIIGLSSGQTLTINNGAKGDKGESGSTPVISVKMDTDGNYYWTLDGEFIIADGHKLPVTGQEGGLGITPRLRIDPDTNYWEVSYDNGNSWTSLGVKATGKDGTNGGNGDSFFRDVTEDENNVYFTLADGTIISLPKGSQLEIEFDSGEQVAMAPGAVRELRYTVKSGLPDIDIEIFPSADITATLFADPASRKTGTIRITTGDAVTADSKVVVFVTNGNKVIMRRIQLEEGVLRITDNKLKSVPSEGGVVTLEFLSNVGYSVDIPEGARSWISVVPQTRTLESYTVELKIEPNEELARVAEITVRSVDGYLPVQYTIEQAGKAGVFPYQTHYMYDDIIGGYTTKGALLKTWDYYGVDVSAGATYRDYLGQVVISENTTDDTGSVDYVNISGLSTIPVTAGYDDTMPVRWVAGKGMFYVNSGQELGYWNDYNITVWASTEEGEYYLGTDVMTGGFVGEGFIAFVPDPANIRGGRTFTGLNFAGTTDRNPSNPQWIKRYKWLLLVDSDVFNVNSVN
jgi:hypothetical protein